MIISCNWLKKYMPSLPPIPELVQTLTFSGIEVEAVRELPALAVELVTARVLTAERIEGSDHLILCMVDYGGTDPVQVVCGAPNCRAGLISVLALPGADISGLVIKKTRLKGFDSHGMLCSERELQISDNHSGIVELEPDTPLGLSPNTVYDLPDTILELEITPNRSDLLGYLGIARDLSATLGIDLIKPSIERVDIVPADITSLDLIQEQPEKCPRYTARVVSDVKVKESPQWLKTTLVKSGLRPINNIVDITNFVMLETGHPLHAFDYHKLQPRNASAPDKTIIIRTAKEGEQFAALDGKRYVLDQKDLVIADGKAAAALAGVIGGSDTAISIETTTIVLEAATFNPQSIRATAYKHKISTDSSYRFERHLSEETPVFASERAISLIATLAGGKVHESLHDSYPQVFKQAYLAVRPQRFKDLIGFEISESDIIKYLEALGCKFGIKGIWTDGLQSDPTIHSNSEMANTDSESALYFQIPSFRKDLTREADLIEELARLAGFDKIPQKQHNSQIMDRHAHRIKRYIADHLTINGFHEMLNFSFSDPSQLAAIQLETNDIKSKLISLLNPQSSNQSALRLSLLPQLLSNLSYNINHGERNLKIFEMANLYVNNGSSYQEPIGLIALMTGLQHNENWKSKPEAISLYHVKGVVEDLFDQTGIGITSIANSDKPWLVESDSIAFLSDTKLCATIGRIRSDVAERFDIDVHLLKQDIWMLELEVETLCSLTRGMSKVFQTIPKFPPMIRDISFLIDTAVSYQQIISAIQNVDSRLIKNVNVFDEYRGKQVPEGHRSLSLHIFLRDDEKTLTDEHVEHLIDTVVNTLTHKWQIKMR